MGQYNTAPQDDDMMINNNLGGLPIQVVINRDRWQETEADSGTQFNDVIKGTDGVLSNPRLVGGAGFTGCDALDQAGVARITGLAALLPPVSAWVGTAAETSSLSATGVCPLTGPVWGEGDILLGGPGNDTITGRSGDEIIDGDKELRVAIAVTNGAGTVFGRTDSMAGLATSGNFGPGTAGMTLNQAVFSGLVDPGNLRTVREIVDNVPGLGDCASAAPVNCDTAVFSGPRSQYTITNNANGSVSVFDTNTTPATVVAGVVTPASGDGTDTLWNVERMQFADTAVGAATLVAPTVPTALSASASDSAVTLSWTAPAGPISSFEVLVKVGGTTVRTITGLSRTSTGTTVAGLTNGTTYTFQVRAVNDFGASSWSTDIGPVTPRAVPGSPTGVSAVAGNAQATVSWTAPASDGGSALLGYSVRVMSAAGAQVGALRPATSSPLVVTGLTNGQQYQFQLAATNAIGTGAYSALSAAVTPMAPVVLTRPSAPRIGTAVRGALGGSVTATANWLAPLSNGGSAIIRYRVTAVQVNINGVATGLTVSVNVGPGVRSRQMTLPAGRYRFRVVAVNAVGTSPSSALSNTVRAR